MKALKPGEIAPDSGILVEVGPRGGRVNGGRRVVIEKKETVPPTSKAGNSFKFQKGSITTR